MGFTSEIRVLALGLITDRGRIFVSQGYDAKKKQTYYRSLGGGVDFGETSAMALEREFQEELDAALANIRYLGCLENIFEYDGKPGHEIVQLYACDFRDRRFYELESVEFNEGKRKKLALWVDCDRFRNGELTLYPNGIERYL
jgi:8-oxo-dGTP pyrophosphatase MutT (NUDIX family)